MINDKFKIERILKDQRRIFYLKGVIDEDTNFDALIQESGDMILNLSGITAINSLGIRAWVNFIKELSGRQLVYEECPPVIVRQMNMIPSFVGSAEVSSVYVPFVCDQCDEEKLVLISESALQQKEVTLPKALLCENCKKGEMELDGHPKQYFAFKR